MFQFLRRAWASGPAAVLDDPWGDADSYYVGQYRPQLDEIAKTLSVSGAKVRTRFNAERKRAELRDGKGIVATVIMHGEVGSVYRTIVQTLLGETNLSLFSSVLPHVQFVRAPPE